MKVHDPKAFHSEFMRALNVICIERGRGIDTEIARYVGVSSAHIGRLRKGKPGSEELRRKIAEFFNLSYEDFLALGREGIPDNHAENGDLSPVTLADLLDVLKSIDKKLSQVEAMESKINYCSEVLQTMTSRAPKKKIALTSLPSPKAKGKAEA